jgi:hypothetical protein
MMFSFHNRSLHPHPNVVAVLGVYTEDEKLVGLVTGNIWIDITSIIDKYS